MAFSILDALADIPPLLVLVQKVEAGVAALPAASARKASDYTTLAASVLPEIGSLIDQVEAQIKAGSAPTVTPPTK